MKLRLTLAGLAVALATAPGLLPAQQKITSPKEFFGFDVGADYELPNYTKLHQYFAKVANESDRVLLDTIGFTELGKPQIMAIVSSPANLKNLARYKEISKKLALAEGIDSVEAKRLSKEGKAIVWIDGGLHATEVLGAQQLIEDLWQFASMNDEETTRFRENTIILLVHANPDGMEMVSNWYMQEPDKLKRTMNIPDLYNKYAGHDDNRDSFMNALKETTNMSRVAFMEWYPQILYNHHQTGPQGMVMFAPPFRDPANYNFHDGIITGIDRLGSALHTRMIAEGKGGTTMRSGSSYSTWWNGGVRTVAYFHNVIGLLTETIGSPTPTSIPFVASAAMRTADLPMPITPQPWHFRQSIDYSITANRAVLDDASRNKDFWLFNRWQMGRDEIAMGNKDTWIITPRHMAEVDKAMAADRGAGGAAGAAGGGRGAGGGGGGGGGGRGGAGAGGIGTENKYYKMLHAPEQREPRGYIMSAAQPDFATTTKFVQALQKSGIQFMRATAPFTVAGKQYPVNSWVVKTNQAFRAHVLDMFEPQDHPDDFKIPGGAPTAPYDNAGWTLAMQMGVQYDRLLDAFDGPFERVKAETVSPEVVTVATKGKAGYYVRPEVNDALTVSNRLAKAGAAAFRIPSGFQDGGESWPAGTWFIPSTPASDKIVQAAAKDLGVSFGAANTKPASAQAVKPMRVALVDRYGGSMPTGWTRLVMEQFEVPYTLVYPQELDKGGLKAKYDVIVLTDGMISDGAGGRGGGGFGGSPDTMLTPAQYRNRLGRISTETTVPKLKEFMEAGGRVITIGSSIALGKQIGLPIDNFLMDGTRPLGREKYYIPGSLLEVKMDTSAMVTTGMPARTIVMFDNSPVMKLGADAAAKGLRPLAMFDNDAPLKSGWAWGQNYLKGGVAIAEAKVGQGNLYLFGPEILFRAQPHGTFKLLLNALSQGFDRPVKTGVM
ncbi:MAG: M14 family metallopeptidase [Gemmatimonas sp.]